MRGAEGRQRGFTLIEVIVVVAVIAILASVAVPVVDLVQSRARGDATRQGMEALGEALESHFIDRLQFPAQLADLAPAGYIAGGFAPDAAFRDAWGAAYVYEPGTDRALVRSLGPDQTEAEPNLDLVVDGTRHLIARTRDDMQTIHIALRNYESRRVLDMLAPLPAVWFDEQAAASSALGILIQSGYLANSTRYLADAWGSAYQYAGTPADMVRSVHVASGGPVGDLGGQGGGGGGNGQGNGNNGNGNGNGNGNNGNGNGNNGNGNNGDGNGNGQPGGGDG